MRELGMTEVIEIGPGKVLSGFLRKIDKAISVSTVEDEASLKALLEK
jgi:[acyl-carrier-protein] S-malonyltransferase